MGRRWTTGCAVLMASLTVEGCQHRSRELSAERERLLGHVNVLAGDIGPRPTGSPGEARARRYILHSLQQAGLDAREDPITEVRLSDTTDVSLSSANVVGILQGERPEAILLGAHHDSRNSRCPGASDDASGVAVLIEAARRLAARPHRHTLVFASFTGEETPGLPGSRWLAGTWKGPPPAAAITMDFVGKGKIFVAPFPSSPALWANRLLAKAEAEANTRRVLFDPWLVIVPRIFRLPYGADHLSLLEAGIPAFNLSCQFPAWTYHTSEDRPSRVDADTLVATLDLVSRMLEALDREVPVREKEDGYLPMRIAGRMFFPSGRMLRWVGRMTLLWLGLTILAYRRELLPPRGWVEGLSILLVAIPFTLLAVSGGFAVEALLARVSGVRHPWFTYPAAHLGGALVATALTFWAAMVGFRFVRPSTRSGSFLAMALLVQFLEAGALAFFGRHDIALPAWLGLAGMLAASCCKSGTRRLAWGLLGAVWSLPFLSATAYRMFLELSGISLPPFSLEGALVAVSLPWFLFFQHLGCLPGARLEGKPLRVWTPVVGGSLVVLSLGGVLFNAARPAYDQTHRIVVQVSELIDVSRKSAEASLASLESLGVVTVEGLQPSRLPAGLESRLSLPWERAREAHLSLEREGGDEEIVLRLKGTFPGAPRTASLKIIGTAPFQVLRSGSWEPSNEYRSSLIPESSELEMEVHLRRITREALRFEAEMSGDEDVLGLQPKGPDRVFRVSSRVRLSGTIP